jgi:hypothetical protein
MKIKVKAILRSPDLTADIGDVLIVDDKMGDLLITAGAAELVVEEMELTLEEAFTLIDNIVEKTLDEELKVELPETEKPIKKGALKK